ncbi:murein biosynthesis integral membrane protein MurJ [Bacillus infantis]|uniref:murein biosynthesis integral membrane protein MurJ n=1 Tax=Bacillus infantis TaxID=324767 RepID=UPI00200579C9|nr:murein biosynthesis integral membrane protein MurJ [Bacillus infantis]MCK6206046.1 murein biosynthesis integral membrane protein MurJ [Bacillus infantis]
MKGKIFKIIGAVAVINILARLLGFAREQAVAIQYGTSDFADSIIAVYTIPNFLYVVVGGAITTAFISVYSKVKEGPEQEKFMSSTFTYIMAIIGVLTVLLIVFTDPLLKFMLGEMDAKEYEVAKSLYYWMAPSTFFLILSMWLSGILNVNQQFHLSTLSTFIYNLVFFALALLLTPLMSFESYGFGALAGAVIMIIMLIVGLGKEHLKHFKIRFALSEELKRLFIIAMPIMLGGAALQVYALLQRVFGSRLDDGLVSALNYASKLTQFPQAVLMTAVTTVIYPSLAKKAAENDLASITSLYQKGLRWLGLLLLPVTIFVIIYAQEIVQVIFQYGNFDDRSTAVTYPLLQIFALSMFTFAANVYVTRFFYAMENSYMPVLISIFCVFGINIGITLLFIEEYGARAIAWGTSISSIVNFILLLLLAKNVLKLKIMAEKIGSLGKTLAFYAGIAVIVTAFRLYLSTGMPWIDITIGGLVFLGAVLALMKLLKFPELQMILNRKNAAK